VQRAAVYDCVAGWTTGGQYDTCHGGLPLRYAAGFVSECIHGCVVITGIRFGECQLDATARVVPVPVYPAPRLAPLRRMPLPFPVDEVMDLVAGEGIRSPERVEPDVLAMLERLPGLLVDPWAGVGVQGSQRSTRLRARSIID
jgi:hypothetical protein